MLQADLAATTGFPFTDLAVFQEGYNKCIRWLSLWDLQNAAVFIQKGKREKNINATKHLFFEANPPHRTVLGKLGMYVWLLRKP